MIHTQYRYEVMRRGSLMLLRLMGEIDHHSACPLREDIDRLLIAERPRRLVFDLQKVAFMDSAGLGLLMGRLRLMRELGGVVALRNVGGRILKMLHLAGMERFMEIEGEDIPRRYTEEGEWER